MNKPDHISESLETVFWVKILKFFDADPGWKKFGSGIRDGKDRFRDPDSGKSSRIRNTESKCNIVIVKKSHYTNPVLTCCGSERIFFLSGFGSGIGLSNSFGFGSCMNFEIGSFSGIMAKYSGSFCRM